MTHDMSIHTHEVGDTLTGEEFGQYLKDWGCTPMRPNNFPRLERFICMKEVNGYTETWDVTASHKVGQNFQIDEMTRVR